MNVRKKELMAICLTMICLHAVNAEQVQWKLQGPFDIEITNLLLVGEDSLVLAKTATSALHRSLDNGTSWQSVNENEFNDDPNLAIEYAGQFSIISEEGQYTNVYVSSDGTLKSTIAVNPPDLFLRSVPSIDPNKTETQYAFTETNRLVKTENRWNSLFPITLGLPSADNLFLREKGLIFVHPQKSNTLFVSFTQPFELYVTKDGGFFWEGPILQSRLSSLFTSNFRFDKDTPDKIYSLSGHEQGPWSMDVISDDGSSKTPITGFSEALRLSFDVRKSGEIFAFYDQTDDFGPRSTILNIGTPENKVFQDQNVDVSGSVIAVSDEGRIYLGTTDGIYISGDMGSTWQERLVNGSLSNNGFQFESLMIEDMPADRFSMSVVARQSFLGAGRGQVFKSRIIEAENRIEWELESSAYVTVDKEEIGQGTALDWRNNITYSWQLHSGDRSSLTKKIGESSVNLGVPNGSVIYDLIVDSNIPTTLFVATGSGFFKSENGGFLWESVSENLIVSDIVVPAGDTTAVFGLTAQNIVVTRDRWQSFRTINIPDEGADFLYVTPVYPDQSPFIPDHFLVVGTMGGVFTTLLPKAIPLIADFNDNGSVDFPDFLLFIEKFGKTKGEEGFDGRFDFNGDNTVGFPDFLMFVQQFGKTSEN